MRIENLHHTPHFGALITAENWSLIQQSKPLFEPTCKFRLKRNCDSLIDMNDYWTSELAKYRQSPIVDLYSVLSGEPSDTSYNGKSGLYELNIYLGAWRVGDGKLQRKTLVVAIHGSESELENLIGVGGLLHQH